MARSGWPSRRCGRRRARGCAQKLAATPGGNSQRRGGQSLGDAARRIGKGAAHRRAHRFRAEWRLARRLPERAGGRRNSAAHQRAVCAASRRSPCGSSIGPTRKARALAKVLFGSSACSGNLDMDEARGLRGQGRHPSARRAARARHRFRERERQRQRTGERRRLSRTAHRAGPGAARSRSAARRGARHVRRRAPRDHLSRTGRAFRQHADESPQGRLPRRGEDESRKFTASPSAAAAASAPSAPARRSPASSPASSRNAASRSTSAISMPPRWRRCCAKRKKPASASRAKATSRVSWERLWHIAPRPFQRRTHRALRRSHPRNLRRLPSPAERPAARRRRSRRARAFPP